MKKFSALFIAVLLIIPLAVKAQQVIQVKPSPQIRESSFLGFVPNRFIVVLKETVPVDHARDKRSPVALAHLDGFNTLSNKFKVKKLRPQFFNSDRGPKAESKSAKNLARHYKVTISEGTLEQAMAEYEKNPFVDHVQPIGIHTFYATPNDNPDINWGYPAQWGYHGDYGIDADLAWDNETGSPDVIVGVLDTGVKYDHVDLGGSNPPGPDDADTNGNIWVNENETPGNGEDDDENGYVDDIIGWDFVERGDWYGYTCSDLDCETSDNDPFDGHGHGTHVAGTIAAITNNGYAVAGTAGGWSDGTYTGVANGVKIVPLRIGYEVNNSGGIVIMDYVAEAMYYMAGLKIRDENVAAVNCSFGSSDSGGLQTATDYLIAQDVMVIVAAGNSGSSEPDYLGSRNDCLDVGATDKYGDPASWSNYGSWVDIAAPGVDILSTYTVKTDPGTDYVTTMSGTSMSCPHVVGVAALLESKDPALSAEQKRSIILNNTTPYNYTKDVGVGIVNANNALNAIGPASPVAEFQGTPTSGSAPHTVVFEDLSSNSPYEWTWTFGDGGTAYVQNPSHTYEDPGTYTVSLTATNEHGSDTITKIDYITVNEPSIKVKEYSYADIPVAGTISGNYTDTLASDGAYERITEVISSNHPRKTTSYLEHKWAFNVDTGNSVTFYLEAYRSDNEDGDDFVFEYSTDGSTYYDLFTVNDEVEKIYFAQLPSSLSGMVYVRVTDSNSSWGNNSLDTIHIDEMYFEVDMTPTKPTANFIGEPTTGYAPLEVKFTDLSSGAPATWSWEFGDDNFSSEQNPTFTYEHPGTYDVKLTVTNDSGTDVLTKYDYINVSEKTDTSTVHVESITVSRKTARNHTTGQAEVLVYDQDSAPVSGAVVYGKFNLPNDTVKNGITGPDGIAFISGDKTKDSIDQFCFEVTDIQLSDSLYAPDLNDETSDCE
ncbi:S8 family serine peptidase [Desulfobacula sp.]|uniref:S8 family serine peptidase n=1 Tax=Desulfobacula sp. TaxID=2593537 RepID=UPI0025C14843|nr:S8 family serine peptidase [Desulfobacula sp.]MBC2705351.1 S8 family serine peptidase [Desulfobacula sp.]